MSPISGSENYGSRGPKVAQIHLLHAQALFDARDLSASDSVIALDHFQLHKNADGRGGLDMIRQGLATLGGSTIAGYDCHQQILFMRRGMSSNFEEAQETTSSRFGCKRWI